jgi:hypothetical protein
MVAMQVKRPCIGVCGLCVWACEKWGTPAAAEKFILAWRLLKGQRESLLLQLAVVQREMGKLQGTLYDGLIRSPKITMQSSIDK